MRFSTISILGLLFTAILFSCNNKQNTGTPTESRIAIIPLPKQLSKTGDFFTLKEDATIGIPEKGPEWQRVADYLNGKLEAASGQKLEVHQNDKAHCF